MLIRIRNYEFVTDEPYAGGQVMTPGEARALNALRAERIREAITRRVIELTPPANKGTEATSRLLTPEALARLQAEVLALGKEFVFREVPRTARKTAGTIEAEARALAVTRVETEARSQGIILSDEAKLRLVDSALADKVIQLEARRRVEARKAVAEAALRELL